MAEIITINSSSLKHIIVLDVKGVYAEICDEAWLSIDRLDLINAFTQKYSNKNKYLIIEL